MRIKKLKIVILLLLSFNITFIQAQQSTVITAVNTSSSGGTILYPVEQIVYNTNTGLTSLKSVIGDFTHYLGESFNGGIIYYLYKGSDGLEHGLIVGLTEKFIVLNGKDEFRNGDRTEDGAYNTALMTSIPLATYISSLGKGWYLPSIDELALLYYNRYNVQKSLRATNNTLLSDHLTYLSSTEYTGNTLFSFNFFLGHPNLSDKEKQAVVRAIRAF